MARIISKKTLVDGHLFDSKTEAEYYIYLCKNRQSLNIKEIIKQPSFQLLNEFDVPCNRCRGEGKKPSPKTGRPIQCRRCEGSGKTTNQSWNYTADFKVIYEDGYSEVIDVKGYADAKFPLYRKLFEYTYGIELVVIKKSNKGWIRK